MAVDAGRTVRNYGVTPLHQMRAMSGLEFLQAWIDGRLPSPPISHAFDFDAVAVEKGRIVAHGSTTCMVFS